MCAHTYLVHTPCCAVTHFNLMWISVCIYSCALVLASALHSYDHGLNRFASHNPGKLLDAALLAAFLMGSAGAVSHWKAKAKRSKAAREREERDTMMV